MLKDRVNGLVFPVIILLAAAGPGHLSVAADELRQTRALPLSLAQQAATAAVAQCRQDGYRVSAAVVDRGGNVQALLRADGAGPHTPDSSRKKAYTAASLGRSTRELAQLIVKIPSIQALRDMNENILILGGGLPIKIGGEVVGGIGVGGAPGDRFDEACARKGLETIKASLDKPADQGLSGTR